MAKYTTVKVHGVIIAIAEKSKITGYTKTLLEPLLLTDDEMDKMSDGEILKWTRKNNEFVEKVCKLMNDHNV